MVDATISQVREEHPVWRKPTQAQRGTHSATLLIVTTHRVHFLVNRADKIFQNITSASIQATSGDLEALGQQASDLVHRDPTGELPTFGSTHAVTDGKDVVGLLHATLADLA
jgi:hypothetical protein